MATAETPGLVLRFTRTERALHWIHTGGFVGMLATGLPLYLPALAQVIGRRELVKDLHLLTAIAWMAGLLVVLAAGNRSALRASWAEIESLDDDDRRWLRRRPATQGRFNAGQKLHTLLQAAFALLFVLSGVLLWLGERNTAFRLDGTVVLHDVLTFVATLLVLGHIYLALINRSTRPAMRGMTRGTVESEWAERHHAKWKPRETSAARPQGAPSSEPAP